MPISMKIQNFLRHGSQKSCLECTTFNCFSSMAARAIIILGTTGTGKSKLAIELAKQLGGEVISADSKQIFEGLDIGSAKVSVEEMKEVPHHLVNSIPAHSMCSVREFQHLAQNAIDDIHSRGLVPIIVGGTNYYIESLLFPANSLISCQSSSNVSSEPACSTSNDQVPSTNSSSDSCLLLNPDSKQTVYEKLQQIDPIMAEKLHPNDVRKITRALQVFEQTGKPMSAYLLAQPSSKQCSSALPALCIWLHSPLATHLDARLDSRIDDMVRRGLLMEVIQLHCELIRSHKSISPAHPYAVQYYEHRTRSSTSPSSASKRKSPDEESPASSSSTANQDDTSDSKYDQDSSHQNFNNSSGLHESIGFREFQTLLFQLPEHVSTAPIQQLSEWGVKIERISIDISLESIIHQAASVFYKLYSSAPADDNVPKNINLIQIHDSIKSCIELIKRNTRRYARKQIRWIKNRFYSQSKVPEPTSSLDSQPQLPVPIYCLDSSDPSLWTHSVREPALKISLDFLHNLPLVPIREFWPPSDTGVADIQSFINYSSSASSTSSLGNWHKYTCETCDNRVLNGFNEWQVHLQTKGHKARLKRMRQMQGFGSAAVSASSASDSAISFSSSSSS